MFNALADRLAGIFDKLRGRGVLTEEMVDTAMREIKIALLEADVALPVVKSFIATVKEQAVGQNVIKTVQPVQQVVKIVNDALIETLGSDDTALKTAPIAPTVLLMLGLQGSGKTTSSAKLAARLKKEGKRVLMASLDISTGGTRTTARFGRSNRCRYPADHNRSKTVGYYPTCFTGSQSWQL